jgi:predicted HTH domain antitoxin
MHQVDFQKLLGSRGIWINYDVEDFEEDIRHLEERGWL